MGVIKMRQLIVFSLDLVNNPASEQDRDHAIGLLKQCGLVVRPALGIYKGQSENSYMVEVDHKGQFALIKSICIHYSQESVLSVNLESLEATLHYLSQRGRKEILGHWIKTNEINSNAMTIDLSTLQGYVVR